MDDSCWQEGLRRRARMEERARGLLAVGPAASDGELKRAYRSAAKESHPDKAGGDGEGFRTLLAAYRFLAEGEESPLLLPAVKEAKTGKYHLDNDWGYFLWWSDQFF